MKKPLTTIVIILTVAFCSIHDLAKSQFVYLDGGLTYDLGIFRSEELSATIQHAMLLSISGEIRPKRTFGFGGELNIPVVQFGSFTMKGSETLTDALFFDFDIDPGSELRRRYFPDEYDYRIRQNITPRLFLRYYFWDESEAHFFIEGRLAFGNMSEEFTFIRAFQPQVPQSFSDPYPALPEVNIEHKEERSFAAPGLQFGLRKTIENNLSLTIGGGMDFILFDDNGFEYVISHDINIATETNELVLLESQAQGSKPSFFFDFSIGYFF